MSKSGERHACPCPCQCHCSAAGPLCAMCTEGVHASPDRPRLLDRAVVWGRIVADLTPDSSSGISVKALQTARDRFARTR